MKIKSIAFLIALFTGIKTMNGQTAYSIDASKIKNATLQSGHLMMGTPGPKGRKIVINNRYMTLVKMLRGESSIASERVTLKAVSPLRNIPSCSHLLLVHFLPAAC